ncbi:histone-lysine N-methyltransferase SETMAR [Trichonephila clavipes]|nr:histone-lysine N-methyltransferase SETMAR [Trichonephila clavipes]
MGYARETSCSPFASTKLRYITEESSPKSLEPFEPTTHSSSHSKYDLYCQQLGRLKLEIDQKWPELANRLSIAFHQDNAMSYTSIVARQNLRELGWEVIMHPQSSPDFEPSDYHLFLALQKLLGDKKFGSSEDWENRLLDAFANKGQDFSERGI